MTEEPNRTQDSHLVERRPAFGSSGIGGGVWEGDEFKRVLLTSEVDEVMGLGGTPTIARLHTQTLGPLNVTVSKYKSPPHVLQALLGMPHRS